MIVLILKNIYQANTGSTVAGLNIIVQVFNPTTSVYMDFKVISTTGPSTGVGKVFYDNSTSSNQDIVLISNYMRIVVNSSNMIGSVDLVVSYIEQT